jgi:hypothetical protein
VKQIDVRQLTDCADCPAGANVRGVVLEFKLGIDLKAISVDVRPRASA